MLILQRSFSTPLIQIILQQPALDRAVVKKNPSRCPQPHFLGQIEISGKYIPEITLTFFFEKVFGLRFSEPALQ